MKDIYQVLDQLNIKFQKYDHSAVFTVAESEKLHLKIPGARTKNLFLRNKKKTAYYLVCALADKAVDLKKLTRDLNEDRLSFSSAEDLQKFLGVAPGSVSVFGLINDQAGSVKAVIDNGFFKFEKVGFHPNDNTATVVISSADLKKFLTQSGRQIFYQDI